MKLAHINDTKQMSYNLFNQLKSELISTEVCESYDNISTDTIWPVKIYPIAGAWMGNSGLFCGGPGPRSDGGFVRYS